MPRGLSICIGIPRLAISVETSTRSELAVSTTIRSGFTSSNTCLGVRHGQFVYIPTSGSCIRIAFDALSSTHPTSS